MIQFFNNRKLPKKKMQNSSNTQTQKSPQPQQSQIPLLNPKFPNHKDLLIGYTYKKHPQGKKLKINTSKCRGEYKLIRKIIKQNDWIEVFKEGDLLWSGLSLSAEEIDIAMTMRVNRFPEMPHLCHKRTTGFILNKFRQYWPGQFQFYPKTYLLPEDEAKLGRRISSKGGVFIAKPSKGSQGDGIALIKKLSDIPKCGDNQWIVQPYIDNPLLLQNRKFDLRLYVMISSIDPYICYLSQQGLGRLCTQQYQKPSKQNLINPYIHLTNYSLNKNHPNYQNSQSQYSRGGKRCLQVIWQDLLKKGIDIILLKSRINQLVKKFLISLYPFVKYYHHATYKNNYCNAKNFHVIGIDVLVDEELRPWFLQANNNPSFNIDHESNQVVEGKTELKKQVSPVDMYVKRIVIQDAIFLANRSLDKQKEMEIGQHYYSFEKILDSQSEDLKQMNIIENILKLFHSQCSIRSKWILTNSQFSKISNLQGMTNDRILKNDYHLIFIKIMRNKPNVNQMQFEHFVQAIQYIIKEIVGYNKDNKLSVMKNYMNSLVSQL